MLRQGIVQSVRPALRSNTCILRVTPITAVRNMAAGDVGGTRSGGEAAGDAFNKREKADENYYIKKMEKEKLMALKEKLQQQRKHLTELEKHIDEVSREQSGGEQH